MRVPFTIAFKPPHRADLRRPGCWAFLIVPLLPIAVVAALGSRGRPATAVVADATLSITSTPAGAVILIAGKERGRTPATLPLPAGEVLVTLRLPRYAEATYTINVTAGQATTLDGILWLRTPEARRVRPPLPGASIVAASFLADSRLALGVALPPGDERQLWIVDHDGVARRVGPPVAHVALAPSADGARIAYLTRTAGASNPSTGSGGETRANEVWITDRDGDRGERRYALSPNTADEHLVDLAWAPDGAHLLLVSQLRP